MRWYGAAEAALSRILERLQTGAERGAAVWVVAGARIGDDRRGFLPWAWATNGCFSVFGIFASRIAGLFWGFDRALLIGFAVYVIAALCAVAHARTRRAAADGPADRLAVAAGLVPAPHRR